MKKHTSLLKIILIFSLVHMLIVQWPLVTQVLLMVDVTHLNGAYALFVIEAIQFFYLRLSWALSQSSLPT